MKLRSIKITNFRQFYGSQQIDFSIDPKRNVTLIHGENNGGKTAILNAIRWCLYEETTENLLDPRELMNKHALAERTSTSFAVSVQLIHDNRLFEVTRRQSSGNNAKSLLQIFEIIDGCYSEKPEKHPMTLINTFLPQEMVEYFFYQGEGTGTLNSQNDFSHINDAIRKVLGLTLAEKTIEHLRKIKSDYQKNLIQHDTSNKLSRVLKEKESYTDTLSQKEAFLNDKEAKLVQVRKDWEVEIGKLAKFNQSSIEKHLKDRSQKEQYISDLERRKKELLFNKQKSLNAWMTSAFTSKLAELNLDIINTDELKKTMRYSVDKNLIKEILSKAECLCGKQLPEGSEARLLIDELSKVAIDTELVKRWKKVSALQVQLRNIKNPHSAMINLLSELDDNEEKITELKAEVDELSFLIRDSKIQDIREIEIKKNALYKENQELEQLIFSLKESIRKLKIDIQNCELQIQTLNASIPIANKFKNRILATDEILKIYDDAILSSKKDVDNLLLKDMQDLFSKVAFNGYTVRKESVQSSKKYKNENSFVWVIVDDNGKKVAPGNGFQAMLAISFIVALIKFSKKRSTSQSHLLTPGTVAPFIADSILAFISPDNGKELVRYIAESVEQSIFMLSQAQWTETHIDVGIRDKIGKEYNLVQHTKLSKEQFKGSNPTKLSVQGHEYDVVRFNAQFDCVTIEEISARG